MGTNPRSESRAPSATALHKGAYVRKSPTRRSDSPVAVDVHKGGQFYDSRVAIAGRSASGGMLEEHRDE